MRILLLAALCLFATAPAGPRAGTVSPLRARLTTTVALFRSERYAEADAQSQELIADALRAGDMHTAAHATGNLGAMRFALHRYRPALAAFLEARRMMAEQHDVSGTAAMDANLASLYMEMGDLEEAGRRMEGALAKLSGDERRDHMAETQILLAQLRARQRRMPEALRLFRLGIEGAQAREDWKLAAFAWNRLGEEYLKQGNLEAAEAPLLEAFRIRLLRHLPLDTSYRNLGRLRLEQGDLPAAGRLLDEAIALAAQPQGPIPNWDAYHYRGRALLARGRLPEALENLRTAVRLARAWRWSAPSDDASRLGAETWLDRVYSALIDAGNELYLRTGDASLMRETFEACEENRAGSLRMLIQGPIATAESLPAAYWPAVTRLQQAEVRAARLPTPAADEEAIANREAVAQMEADALDAAPVTPRGLLERARTHLGNDDALLAFHLGSPFSWLWAVDRGRLALYRLTARENLEALAAAFGQALSHGDADAVSAGAQLYTALFGELEPQFQKKSRWLLALDDSLFSVAFAALPSDRGFLAQRHTIQIIPGAAMWPPGSVPAPNSNLFLGVGDAIYNAADPRRQPTVQAAAFIPLPRLVASSAELEVSAGAWGGGTQLLEGAQASRAQLIRALSRRPALIHFATHFLETGGPNPAAAIVLSLGSGGRPEIVDAAEVATWRVAAELVALSGCRSASGEVRPGAGLLGLTRAWLAAGARNVLATHWEVSDDSGPLFAAFYRQLAHGHSPAAALRTAQMEMAASQDWRADPRYWAAYFVMGKE